MVRGSNTIKNNIVQEFCHFLSRDIDYFVDTRLSAETKEAPIVIRTLLRVGEDFVSSLKLWRCVLVSSVGKECSTPLREVDALG